MRDKEGSTASSIEILSCRPWQPHRHRCHVSSSSAPRKCTVYKLSCQCRMHNLILSANHIWLLKCTEINGYTPTHIYSLITITFIFIRWNIYAAANTFQSNTESLSLEYFINVIYGRTGTNHNNLYHTLQINGSSACYYMWHVFFDVTLPHQHVNTCTHTSTYKNERRHIHARRSHPHPVNACAWLMGEFSPSSSCHVSPSSTAIGSTNGNGNAPSFPFVLIRFVTPKINMFSWHIKGFPTHSERRWAFCVIYCVIRALFIRNGEKDTHINIVYMCLCDSGVVTLVGTLFSFLLQKFISFV